MTYIFNVVERLTRGKSRKECDYVGCDGGLVIRILGLKYSKGTKFLDITGVLL